MVFVPTLVDNATPVFEGQNSVTAFSYEKTRTMKLLGVTVFLRCVLLFWHNTGSCHTDRQKTDRRRWTPCDNISALCRTLHVLAIVLLQTSGRLVMLTETTVDTSSQTLVFEIILPTTYRRNRVHRQMHDAFAIAGILSKWKYCRVSMSTRSRGLINVSGAVFISGYKALVGYAVLV